MQTPRDSRGLHTAGAASAAREAVMMMTPPSPQSAVFGTQGRPSSTSLSSNAAAGGPSSPRNKEMTICRNFLFGACRLGSACQFVHGEAARLGLKGVSTAAVEPIMASPVADYTRVHAGNVVHAANPLASTMPAVSEPTAQPPRPPRVSFAQTTASASAQPPASTAGDAAAPRVAVPALNRVITVQTAAPASAPSQGARRVQLAPLNIAAVTAAAGSGMPMAGPAAATSHTQFAERRPPHKPASFMSHAAGSAAEHTAPAGSRVATYNAPPRATSSHLPNGSPSSSSTHSSNAETRVPRLRSHDSNASASAAAAGGARGHEHHSSAAMSGAMMSAAFTEANSNSDPAGVPMLDAVHSLMDKHDGEGTRADSAFRHVTFTDIDLSELPDKTQGLSPADLAIYEKRYTAAVAECHRTNRICQDAADILRANRMANFWDDYYKSFEEHKDRVHVFVKSVEEPYASDPVFRDKDDELNPSFRVMHTVWERIHNHMVEEIPRSTVRRAIEERFHIKLTEEGLSTLLKEANPRVQVAQKYPVRLMEDKKVIERMLWALEMVWTPTLESRFDIAHCYGLAFRPETEALYRLALRKLLQFKDLGASFEPPSTYRDESRRIIMNFDRDGDGSIGPVEMSYILFALGIDLTPKGMKLLFDISAGPHGDIAGREVMLAYCALREASLVDRYDEVAPAEAAKSSTRAKDDGGDFEYLFSDAGPQSWAEEDNRRVLIDSKYVGQALQDPAALKPSMEAFKTVMFNVVYWLFLPFSIGADQVRAIHTPRGAWERGRSLLTRLLARVLLWAVVSAVFVSIFLCVVLYNTTDMARQADVTVLEGVGPAVIYFLWIVIDSTSDAAMANASRYWRLRLRQGFLKEHCQMIVRMYDTCETKSLDAWTVMQQIEAVANPVSVFESLCELSNQTSKHLTNAALSLIALVHALLPSVARFTFGQPPFGERADETFVILFSGVANFLMAFIILAVLIAIQQRLLKYCTALQRFTALTQRRSAMTYFSYFLNLSIPQNVVAWSRMRAYLMESRAAPIRQLQDILGWCIMIAIVLAGYFAVNGILNSVEITPVFATFMYDLLLLAVLLLTIISYGAKVNDLLSKHVGILTKLQFHLTLLAAENNPASGELYLSNTGQHEVHQSSSSDDSDDSRTSGVSRARSRTGRHGGDGRLGEKTHDSAHSLSHELVQNMYGKSSPRGNRSMTYGFGDAAVSSKPGRRSSKNPITPRTAALLQIQQQAQARGGATSPVTVTPQLLHVQSGTAQPPPFQHMLSGADDKSANLAGTIADLKPGGQGEFSSGVGSAPSLSRVKTTAFTGVINVRSKLAKARAKRKHRKRAAQAVLESKAKINALFTEALHLVTGLIYLLKEADEPLKILGVVLNRNVLKSLVVGLATVMVSTAQDQFKRLSSSGA